MVFIKPLPGQGLMRYSSFLNGKLIILVLTVLSLIENDNITIVTQIKV